MRPVSIERFVILRSVGGTLAIADYCRATPQANHHRDPPRSGGWVLCDIYTRGQKSKVKGVGGGGSTVVAEARHLGRTLLGGCPQAVAALRGGSKAVGNLGKHQPTKPVAENEGAEIRRLQHVSAGLG